MGGYFFENSVLLCSLDLPELFRFAHGFTLNIECISAMKSFFSFLIFTFVTAFMFFAIMKWGIGTETVEAIGAVMGALIGGLGVDVFRKYFKK